MRSQKQKPRWRAWLRFGFLAWGLFVFTYLFSGYRTEGVSESIMKSGTMLEIENSRNYIGLSYQGADRGLIFLCGSGVSAKAYMPLLRPIAEDGYTVYIVKLPYRFAFLNSQKLDAIKRTLSIIEANKSIESWVLAGHSLGGAISCLIVRDFPQRVQRLVLVGTTHPKSDDLTHVTIPVTKIYGSHDGIAKSEKVLANKHLLPSHTQFIEITGGNHIQFGNYAMQFMDGKPGISREEQQSLTRSHLLKSLQEL